ncbi:D-alanyl-D-alanine carboxypeptidase [Candidatus Curtissbacteria bacterium]|nr:D-alanyl-D-alanine carboxypeptidase [Candidatus Curtissbacteria bacterium]
MGRFVSVLLLSFLALGIFYLARGEDFNIISPLPRAHGQESKSPRPNDWFPKEARTLGVKDPGLPSLQLSSKSAILVDFDSGETIFGKNPKERLPVASTVKIMTALIALENRKLEDIFTVSENAYRAGENSMDLSPGEKLTLRELLYGLILVSGNDAAVAVAEGVAGSEEKFVEMMNKRARELGLSDTQFVNASGLDLDGQEQYSTSFDMATIARYLWESQVLFREISQTYHWTLGASGEHKAFDLYSDTNLLTTYPGVKGIKPGFTWEAGMCLVTYAENEGKRLLAVVLGSSDRRGEMKELLDYGFASFGIKVSHPGLDL